VHDPCQAGAIKNGVVYRVRAKGLFPEIGETGEFRESGEMDRALDLAVFEPELIDLQSLDPVIES
jgi:hypothetical protein